MKRIVLGTFSCLVIVISLLALASRWPALFWLLLLGVGLYFLFGRKVEVEFRLGIGLYLVFGRKVEVEFRFGVEGGEERRIYGALVWKRRTGAVESVGAQELARLQVGPAGRDG